MLIKEIEDLRALLNTMINSEDADYSDILKVSQALDKLIVEYHLEAQRA